VGGAATVGAGTQRFPTVTLCDFAVRQMGTVHSHTLQCVLPINLFNEKIYAFLWFWFVWVAVAVCLSIVRWSWTVGFRTKRVIYIRRHLKVTPLCDCNVAPPVETFLTLGLPGHIAVSAFRLRSLEISS